MGKVFNPGMQERNSACDLINIACFSKLNYAVIKVKVDAFIILDAA